MKVLYLTNAPTPYRLDFWEALGKLCRLTVAYEVKVSAERDISWASSQHHCFDEVVLKHWIRGKNWAFCPALIRLLSRHKFDVVVLGGYSTPTAMLAMLWLRWIGMPYILNADGGIIRKESAFKYKLKSFFIKGATVWLSTGAATTEYLTHYGALRDNIQSYSFTSLKEKDLLKENLTGDAKIVSKHRLGIEEDVAFLSVGQFIHRKGYDVLLKACVDSDKTFGVYIVGGEPTEDYLQLQKEYGLTNVHFVGFKRKNELLEYYKAADGFVLPTREDIWGLVINEAMAYGLPVITTDKCVAGLELVKNGENGFIIPSDNVNALSDKMTILAQDGALRNRMAKRSLELIGDYTIDNMAVQHLKAFEFFSARAS